MERRPDRGAAGGRRRIHRTRRVLGAGPRALVVPGGARQGLPAAMGEAPKSIGELIDDAMDRSWAPTRALTGTLPRIYNRDNVDQRRLGELIDLFNSARFTGQGAARPATCSARSTSTSSASSPPPKASAAASSTPRPAWSGSSSRCWSLRTVASTTRAADRAACSCRPRSSSRPTTRDPRISRLRPGTQRAHLADGEDEPRHPRAQRQPGAAGATPSPATSTPTCRPTTSWRTRRSTSRTGPATRATPRWSYGVPPAGNANYAWIQHILSKLAPGG